MAFAKKYLQFFDSKDWYAMVSVGENSKKVGSFKIISWALIEEKQGPGDVQRITGLISLELPGVNLWDDSRDSTIVEAESHPNFLGYTQTPEDPHWQTVAKNYIEFVQAKRLARKRGDL